MSGTERILNHTNYTLVKVSPGGYYSIDKNHLILKRVALTILAGKELNGEDNVIYRDDVKVKIPDIYHFQVQDKDFWFTESQPPHLILPSGYPVYYILEDWCLEVFCSYTIRWVGSILGENEVDNLIDNLQAFEFGFIDNKDFIGRILADPTKDWSNLYIKNVLQVD